jgi:hypothetical protein
MAKTYKILVNDGTGAEIKPVRVVQGVGANGDPVRLLAKRGWRFELQDELKNKGLAPDQVRIKRVGQSLTLMFEGSQRADVVIEDFYAENTEANKDNGMPKLVGTAENGGVYEYVPQDPAASSMPAALKDGNPPVIVALGGGPLGEDFALSALPLVAAAGGVSGWMVAGGLAAAAVAGGGGGGGGSGSGSGGAAAVVAPAKPTGGLTHDAVNDTGSSAQDSITNHQNPTYSGVADKGATVEVTVNGVTYKTTASTADGSYSIPLTNNGKPLDDGVYTPSIKVSNATGGSITSLGVPFTIDHSADKNQDPSKSPTTVLDDNNATTTTLAIASIDDGDSTTTAATGSKDTGTSKTDFITSDGTLTFKGTATGFTANGDVVHVQVLKANGSVVVDQYVTPDSQGVWSVNNQSQTLTAGDYTIEAQIEDVAGNVVKAASSVALVVATTNGPGALIAKADTNAVTEGAVLTTNSSNTGVLVNDGDAFATTLSVAKVEKGGAIDGSASVVNAQGATHIVGDYGQLDMFADGHYVYTPDGHLSADVHRTETFSYEVTATGNGVTRTASSTLNIDVTGVNALATMSLANAGAIPIGNFTTLSNSNAITVTDPDTTPTNEAVIQGISANGNTQSAGSLGNLTTTGDDHGHYGFSYSTTPTAVLVDTSQHDLFSFTSKDGAINQTLDFVLEGSGAITKQLFHLAPLGSEQSVQGLTVTGDVAKTDTLVLHGSISPTQQTTFDFSAPANTSFTSIEKIDIQGTGPVTLKLCLADLLQGDISNVQAQKLFVTGDANDVVDFHSLTSSHIAVTPSASVVDNVNYNVYRFGNDELYIQTAILNVAVFS